MDLIYNKIFLEHDTGMHPENAGRLAYFKDLKQTKVENGEEYLSLLYSKEYIESVKEAGKHSLSLDPDTQTCPRTYEVACHAVGAAVQASKNNDFALVRPPGHHATADKAMGFCIFNNAAISVQNLINKGKKVFILDFDCHHGNGTAEIFYSSDKVLYMSLHQYPFYPGSGSAGEIGSGDGKGFTINIPLPEEAGDDIYLSAISLFIPIIKEQFKPDIVCCSAGFDGHHSDPIGGLNFSLNAYYETGVLLRKYFKNVFAALEGGYNPEWLAKSIIAFQNGVNGEKPKFSEAPTKTMNYGKIKFNEHLEKLKAALQPYWGI